MTTRSRRLRDNVSSRSPDRTSGKRNTGLVLTNRAVGAALQLGVVVVVARTADARTLGGYLVFSAIVRLIGTAVSFGEPWVALREIAQLDEIGDPAKSLTVFLGCIRAVTRNFLLGVILAIPVAAVVLARHQAGSEALLLIGFGALAVGGYAYTDIGVDALKARSMIQRGVFLDFSLTPLCVIVWAIGVRALGGSAGILGLALAQTIGAVASAATSFVILERDHRRRFGLARAGMKGARRSRAERRTVLSFGATSLLTTAAPSLPQVLLPLVMSLSDVGRIGAAIRLTSVPGVLVVGLSSVFAPRFARLAIANDREGLHHALRESQRWVMGLYLPFAIAFIVLPERLVHILGPDFAQTAVALRILGIGQLVNAMAGLAPMLLTMCNTEAFVVAATGASVFVMGGASLAAGARWGIVGAALGYAASVASRNVMIYIKSTQVIRSGQLVPERVATELDGMTAVTAPAAGSGDG
jgi:O-antigen/teichoic acid export membrane protein